MVIQHGEVLDPTAEKEQEMLDGPTAENDEGEVGGDIDEVDEAKAAHDEASVRTVHAQAIKEAEELGFAMSQRERDIALGLVSQSASIIAYCKLACADFCSRLLDWPDVFMIQARFKQNLTNTLRLQKCTAKRAVSTVVCPHDGIPTSLA